MDEVEVFLDAFAEETADPFSELSVEVDPASRLLSSAPFLSNFPFLSFVWFVPPALTTESLLPLPGVEPSLTLWNPYILSCLMNEAILACLK